MNVLTHCEGEFKSLFESNREQLKKIFVLKRCLSLKPESIQEAATNGFRSLTEMAEKELKFNRTYLKDLLMVSEEEFSFVKILGTRISLFAQYSELFQSFQMKPDCQFLFWINHRTQMTYRDLQNLFKTVLKEHQRQNPALITTGLKMNFSERFHLKVIDDIPHLFMDVCQIVELENLRMRKVVDICGSAAAYFHPIHIRPINQQGSEVTQRMIQAFRGQKEVITCVKDNECILSPFNLFYKVCAEKGIVHRDLKPENLLLNQNVDAPAGKLTPNRSLLKQMANDAIRLLNFRQNMERVLFLHHCFDLDPEELLEEAENNLANVQKQAESDLYAVISDAQKLREILHLPANVDRSQIEAHAKIFAQLAMILDSFQLASSCVGTPPAEMTRMATIAEAIEEENENDPIEIETDVEITKTKEPTLFWKAQDTELNYSQILKIFRAIMGFYSEDAKAIHDACAEYKMELDSKLHVILVKIEEDVLHLFLRIKEFDTPNEHVQQYKMLHLTAAPCRHTYVIHNYGIDDVGKQMVTNTARLLKVVHNEGTKPFIEELPVAELGDYGYISHFYPTRIAGKGKIEKKKKNEPLERSLKPNMDLYTKRIRMTCEMYRAHQTLLQCNILHCDLTPNNIRIDDNDQIRLCNFFNAHLKGKVPLQKAVKSSYCHPTYWKQLQATLEKEKDPIQERSDHWSLAFSAIYLLYGRYIYTTTNDPVHRLLKVGKNGHLKFFKEYFPYSSQLKDMLERVLNSPSKEINPEEVFKVMCELSDKDWVTN